MRWYRLAIAVRTCGARVLVSMVCQVVAFPLAVVNPYRHGLHDGTFVTFLAGAVMQLSSRTASLTVDVMQCPIKAESRLKQKLETRSCNAKGKFVPR